MKHLTDILWKVMIISILISTCLFSASAETIRSCDSIPAKFVDWNSSVTLSKFNPDMGTLKKVDLQCIMNLSQGIELENKNPFPANFTISLLGELNVILPSSQNISINVNHSSQGTVSGYDGVIDYSGPSGVNSSESIPTEAASKSISNLNDFLAGFPGENITLPVKTSIEPKLILSGNANVGITVKAGAQVCITYTYDAKSIDEVGKS